MRTSDFFAALGLQPPQRRSDRRQRRGFETADALGVRCTWKSTLWRLPRPTRPLRPGPRYRGLTPRRITSSGARWSSWSRASTRRSRPSSTSWPRRACLSTTALRSTALGRLVGSRTVVSWLASQGAPLRSAGSTATALARTRRRTMTSSSTRTGRSSSGPYDPGRRRRAGHDLGSPLRAWRRQRENCPARCFIDQPILPHSYDGGTVTDRRDALPMIAQSERLLAASAWSRPRCSSSSWTPMQPWAALHREHRRFSLVEQGHDPTVNASPCGNRHLRRARVRGLRPCKRHGDGHGDRHAVTGPARIRQQLAPGRDVPVGSVLSTG